MCSVPLLMMPLHSVAPIQNATGLASAPAALFSAFGSGKNIFCDLKIFAQYEQFRNFFPARWEWYIHGSFFKHSFVVGRPIGVPGVPPLKGHLVVSNGAWQVEIVPTHWNPSGEVTVSTHAYSLLQIFDLVGQCDSHFGTYSFFFNNCNNWLSSGLAKFFEKGPDPTLFGFPSDVRTATDILGRYGYKLTPV
mmetsp:Transcript_46858/g.92515  ORF Transcript_46858/g.92515 Transcript_46858/m.92515 type:complete len:192 (+) Transcript_46858:531-1106(+)